MFRDNSSDQDGAPRRRISLTDPSPALQRSRTTSNALARAFSGMTISRGRNETLEELRGPLGLDAPLAIPDVDPLADLIFVHGLGGGSRKTWSFGSDPTLFWPKEWLPRDPEFKDVRIHSFGYDSDYVKWRTSNLQVYDFAKALLTALQYSPVIRRSQTPLIFVAHSMGGLVVKRAYLISQSDPDFRELAQRVHAIYFLATPHNGADSAQLLSNILRATNAGSKPFVDDLVENSPAIQAINEEFRYYASHLHLYSFFEAQELSLKGLKKLIVPKTSAQMGLPHEHVSPLYADHRGVCKFEDPADSNYVTIRNALTMTLDILRKSFGRAHAEEHRAQKNRLRNFLGLHGDLYDIDVGFKEPRTEGSCEWLTSSQQFRKWRDLQGSSIFWLEGNPATGKSFLARHVYEHIEALGSRCCYFFFRKGAEKESTLSQCLLHIAYQMACASAIVRDRLFKIEDDDVPIDVSNLHSIWKRLFIGGIFQAHVHNTKFWVIDGLDECKNGDELIQLVSKLDFEWPFRVFFTSRPNIPIERYLKSFTPQPCVQHMLPEHTFADIQRYIEEQIDFAFIKDKYSREHLRSKISFKSQGCFLWVSLMLKELKNVHSLAASQRILDGVPPDMDQLYRRILQTMSLATYAKPLSKEILKWTIYAMRPLTVEELRAALRISLNDDVPDLEYQISSICGHLVFVEPSEPHRVRAIHETARNFLFNLSADSEFSFDFKVVHRDMALACLEQLLDNDMRAPKSRRPSATLLAAVRPPFTQYAALAVFEHINLSSSNDEEIFLRTYEFLSRTHGNVLSWIQFVASQGDLTPLMRAGSILKTYVRRRAKHLPNIGREAKTLDLWSTDFIRLVAKFGHNLRSFTSSIFHIIPPLCPHESALYQQFGHAPRGIQVRGLSSALWDDRIACLIFENRETTSLACSDVHCAIGLSDKTINLYHTSTCQLIVTLRHEERVKLLEFNPSGSMLVSVGRTEARVWDLSSKTHTHEIKLTRHCLSVSFTPDSQALIFACYDNKLYFHYLSDGKVPRVVPWFMDFDHAEKILKQPHTVAFSLEYRLFAFVYRGSHVFLWNWEESDFVGTCEKPLASSQTLPFHASSLAFSLAPGSDTLAAAYEGGDILVFSPLEGSIKASYHVGHDAHTLACSHDGRTLLGGDSTGTIRIFDFLNFDGKTLKPLYIIYGRGDNIRSLSFFGDDLRFIDIRGLQSNVWEPEVLVRADDGDEISDTVSVDLQERSVPIATEIDPIVAMVPDSTGYAIFCGTERGLIKAFSTETGEVLQTLYRHSKGIPITRLLFRTWPMLLASADSSSRVIVRHLSKPSQQWAVLSTILDHRMEEPIEDLLFSPDGLRLLIVTTTQDTLCIISALETEQPHVHFVSLRWPTRNRGIWTAHPLDPAKLLLVVNKRIRIYGWESLQEYTNQKGIQKDFDLPPDLDIQKVHVGWKLQATITEYSSVHRARAEVYLFIWNTDSIQANEETIRPCPTLQSFGARVANLIGSSGKLIGTENEYLFFVDHEGWVCSVKMEAKTNPEHYRRHLFLPSDWLSTSNDILIACTANGDIVFAKEHELAVIKNGLVYTELAAFL